MSEPLLQQVLEAGVLTLTLNRPEVMNAFGGTMREDLRDALAAAESNPQVRCIVITGAGKAFCAGGDVASMARLQEADDTSEIGHRMAVAAEVITLIRRMAKPVIAAVNGAAAGLGLVQALMCDMRFAADTAKFTVAFSKRGLIGEYGISWALPRLVGQANAMDLMFSSRVIKAPEALAMGMVNRVLPDDQLMDFAMAYAADLAMNVSPSSMAVMKRQVYADYGNDVSRSTMEALRLMQESFTRPDFKEGVQSFLQKRQAEFPPVNPDL